MKFLDLCLAAGAATAVLIASGCKGGDAATGGGYVPKKPTTLAKGLVQAGEESKYFPMKVGNQWTFNSETNQMVNGRVGTPQKQEITYKITKMTPSPDGGQDVSFDILNDVKVVDRQIWRINKGGLYQIALGMKLEPFSSPQAVLPFPVKANAKFKWTGSIKADTGEVRTGTNDGTVIGEQPVDTDMGTFNALRIDSLGDLDAAKTKSKVSSIIWFIPGVGIGRYRQEAIGEVKNADPKKAPARFAIVQVMKLKNYSLK